MARYLTGADPLPLLLALLAGACCCSLVLGDGVCSATRLNGSSFHGDLRTVAASTVEECCNACAAAKGCAIWTLSEKCYLRPNSAGAHPFANAAALSGFTSAHVPLPPAPSPPPAPPPAPPPHYPPVPAPTPPPNPCTTCKGPVWSWDTFPVFFHSSDQGGGMGTPKGGFTEAALQTIARFPMVTIEKWQGSAVEPYMYEEDAWLVAARQIKSINPNITVVVWLDSFRIYTDDRRLNPDFGKACTTGHFRPAQFLETHPEYLLKNASGLPALESWSKCHIFDHTKEVARNFWRDMCLTMTGSGLIDGCGADASWQNGVDQAAAWHLDNSTAMAWDSGHKEMMRMTTEALADGVLLGKDPWEVGDYVNGALHEGCAANNDTILTLRNLTRIAQAQGRRLIYQCHGTNSIDAMAAFLSGAGEYHYYGLGGWSGAGQNGNFSEHWVDGVFDQKLGDPLSDATYDQTIHTWSREFRSGTVVKFNAKTQKGQITWGK